MNAFLYNNPTISWAMIITCIAILTMIIGFLVGFMIGRISQRRKEPKLYTDLRWFIAKSEELAGKYQSAMARLKIIRHALGEDEL